MVIALRTGRRRAPAALLLAACLATAAGCGHTAQASRQGTVAVAVTEYRLTPPSVRAHAGQLAIAVHNFGRLTHNLAVMSTGPNGQVLAVTSPIPSGRSGELTVALTPGSYAMASTLLSDQALGAYGTVTVTR